MKFYLRVTAELLQFGAGLVVVLYHLWGVIPFTAALMIQLYLHGSRGVIKRMIFRATGKMIEQLELEKTSGVRCTVYVSRSLPFWHRLAPIMPYCSTGEEIKDHFGLKRLKWSQGIVGRCARTKKIVVDVLTQEQQAHPVEYLVENWGFTETEARKLSQDRRSYLAFPILSSDSRLRGVLYLDAANEQVFQPEFVDKLQSVVPYIGQLLAYRRDVDHG